MNYQEITASFKNFLHKNALASSVSDKGEYQISFTKDDIKNGELTIFKGKVAASDTKIFSEGFQMLSIVSGTFSDVTNLSRCPDDREPYVKAVLKDTREGYNFLMYKDKDEWILLGFTSCCKWIGRFDIGSDGTLAVVHECEVTNQDNMLSEYFVILHASSKAAVLRELTDLVNTHHKKRSFKTPTGWCSWYCYYENISQELIEENLNVLKDKDYLEYVMIDDGYQTHMGDWLSFSDKFPSGFEKLTEKILSAGKKITLWVSPFIASAQSDLFKNHPEYFVAGDDSRPLCSDKLTYSGWREAPWYMLDFSVPEVCSYIHKIFSYFTDTLKITSFKLDAGYWGAVKGCRFRGNISRIENYRKGLEVIARATGGKAMILGCNAPMWPSLGLVDAMRITDDIVRDHDRIREIANQVLARLWQEKLWIIDPDCLVQKDLPFQRTGYYEYSLLPAVILLSGGSVHSGDALSELSEHDLEIIKTLCRYSMMQRETDFNDELNIVYLTYRELGQKLTVYLNLSDDNPVRLEIPKDCTNLFTGEAVLKGEYILWQFRALVTVEDL